MNKEIKPSISTNYVQGIGRVNFDPKKFTPENLRKIVRMQINSVDRPIIGFIYRDGQTRIMGRESFIAAKELNKKALSRFVIRVANQMDSAREVFIARSIDKPTYHPELANDPYSNFVEGLDSLDTI